MPQGLDMARLDLERASERATAGHMARSCYQGLQRWALRVDHGTEGQKLARSHQQSLKQGFSDKIKQWGHGEEVVSSSCSQTRWRLRMEAGLSCHSKGVGGSWGAKELSSPGSSRSRPPGSSPPPSWKKQQRATTRSPGTPGSWPTQHHLLPHLETCPSRGARGPTDCGEGSRPWRRRRQFLGGVEQAPLGGQLHRWGFGFTHLGHATPEGP